MINSLLSITVNLLSKCFLLLGLLLLLSFTIPDQKKENEIDPSAYGMLNYWTVSREYPKGKISSSSIIKAKDFSSKMNSNSLGKIDEPDPWRGMGPDNIGGRTLTIAINPENPSTIYAGSAGGGLWRSYTGGIGPDAWNYISTGFPVLAVSSIAIDPVDTNRIYIGTGEIYNLNNTGTGYADKLTIGSYGIGIFKSSDGGITWENSLAFADSFQVGVNTLKLDPVQRNIIWAATTEGTYKNNNFGEPSSWSRVHNLKMATDLVISPSNPNRVFAVYGNLESPGNGLYKTENGGATWNNLFVFPSIPSIYLLGKARIDANSEIMYSTLGYGDYENNATTATWSYKSENDGSIWIPSSVQNWASYNGWYSHDIAINPENSDEIFAGGLYVWKSTNGGASFSQISNVNIKSGYVPAGEPEGKNDQYVHQNIHEIVYHPVNTNIIYFATDGGVFRTTDGGVTFEGCNGGYQTGNFNGGFSHSQQNKNFIVAGAQGNGTNIYKGFNSWNKYMLPFDGGFTGINVLNDQQIYASYQKLNLFKSNDGGNSFGSLNVPGAADPTAYIAPFVVGVKDASTIYAGRNKIYKSLDGGITWYESNKGGELDGNPIVKMAIDPNNNNVVFAATFPLEQKGAGIKAGLFRTVSDGDDWVEITNTLPDRFVGSIYVDNRGIVYVTLLGFGSSHLFRSNNLGQTWTDIGIGLPDIPTSAIVVDAANPNHIYVGNDIGVYYSSDNGTTWENYSAGLPDAVMVTDLEIFNNERLLRISTNGAGFFERKLATELPTNVVEQNIPDGYSLEQNYPNPFNPSTVISYSVPANTFAGKISLRVFDSLGREIKELVNGNIPAGDHQVEFNAEGLSSGVYYYRLESDEFSITKKMLFIK